MTDSSRHPLGYYAPHTLPFLLTAATIYLGPMTGLSKIVLYPALTILTTAVLVFYWKAYRDEICFTLDIPAIAAGIAVFLVWILLEGHYPLHPPSTHPRFLARPATPSF